MTIKFYCGNAPDESSSSLFSRLFFYEQWSCQFLFNTLQTSNVNKNKNLRTTTTTNDDNDNDNETAINNP